MLRDSQRTKIYRWEGLHVQPLDAGEPRLTLEQAQDLVTEACDLFGIVSAPRVEPKHHGHATGGVSTIYLPTWALRRTVVLHEVAHSISESTKRALSIAEPWHGPVFARVFFTLVCRYFPVEPAALRKTMTAARIKMAAAGLAVTATRTERAALLKGRATLRKLHAETAALRDRLKVIQARITGEEAARTQRVQRIRQSRADAWVQAKTSRQSRAAVARARWHQRQAAKEETR